MNKNAKATLQNIKNQKTDFTLALGDLSYLQAKNEHAWCDFVKTNVGKEYPFELVIGNHDLEQDSSIDQFAACLPNRISNLQGNYSKQYFFDYEGIARFIVVSPALKIGGQAQNYKKDSPEYKELSKTIDEARDNNLKWVIVAMHENCITIGTKNCSIGTDILNLLVKKKVDFILQGHEHGYIRSKQLNLNNKCKEISPKTPSPACTINDENGEFKRGSGPILVISGSGGYELRDINLNREEKVFFSDWHGLNSKPVYGPAIFRIFKGRVEGFFISNQGRVEDHFIVKD